MSPTVRGDCRRIRPCFGPQVCTDERGPDQAPVTVDDFGGPRRALPNLWGHWGKDGA